MQDFEPSKMKLVWHLGLTIADYTGHHSPVLDVGEKISIVASSGCWWPKFMLRGRGVGD